MPAHEYLLFWGKSKAYANEPIPWHPAVYHMLDVAAVFSRLFDALRPEWLDPRYKPLLTLLTALHDIGKISETFQHQDLAHWPTAVLGEPTKIGNIRHDTLGYLIIATKLRRSLPAVWPGSAYLDHWHRLVRASTGHHGYPPEEGDFRTPPVGCSPACHKQVMAIYRDFVDLFIDPSADLPALPDEAEIDRIHWWYAGVVNLADWIGSAAPHWFKSFEPIYTVPQYWALTLAEQVPAAIGLSGVLPCATASGQSFGTLFGFNRPTEMQRWCATVPLTPGPKIVFLEDETGNGKTEAAFMLAYRLMAAGHARGIYCALPTMATANGMYSRVASFYNKFFEPGARPSLSLPHSKSKLHPEFRNTVVRALAVANAPVDDPERDDSRAECAAWLADDRRRSLLADVGVGTIDQAFLAVMRAKYAPIRLSALAGKVLIIDEAHAYDIYMNEILKALLFFHARMGGSVIILSATLPQAMRTELTSAFLRGKDVVNQPPLCGTGYPLVTMADNEAPAIELPFGLNNKTKNPVKRRGRRFKKRVVIESDYNTILDRIERAVLSGAKVAWVRSTVKQAIETAELLHERGNLADTEIDLFHSRFVVGDRNQIEDRVIDAFGKKSARGKRHGCVLIATQVIEQSLDLDFDLMISDPAPLDLLLQRMGRLWRHQRRLRERPGVTEPLFVIASPNPVYYPTNGWLFNMSQAYDYQGRTFELAVEGSFYVYRSLALLWRSVLIMQAERYVGDQSRFRQMVEAAYNKEPFMQHYVPEFEPAAFLEKELEYAETQAGDQHMGVSAPLEFGKGYVAGQWKPEDRVRTRLGRETIDIRIGVVDDAGNLVPVCPPEPGIPRWAYSEVRTDQLALLDGEVTVASHQVKAIKAGWHGFEARIPLIPLSPTGDGWYEGHVLAGDDRARNLRVRYSHQFGLKFE